MILLLDYTEL